MKEWEHLTLRWRKAMNKKWNKKNRRDDVFVWKRTRNIHAEQKRATEREIIVILRENRDCYSATKIKEKTTQTSIESQRQLNHMNNFEWCAEKLNYNNKIIKSMSKKKLKKNSISLKSFGLGDELREKICQIIFFFWTNEQTTNVHAHKNYTTIWR